MKKTRKIMALAMVLVLALAISLPVSAFAAPSSVDVYFDVKSSDSAAPTYGSVFSVNYSIPGAALSSMNTVKDAVDYAATQLGLTLSWIGSSPYILTGITDSGIYYGSVFVDYGYDVDHWYYDGYDWVYKLNGVSSMNYMDEQDLVDDGANVIRLEYDLWHSEWN